MLLGQLSRTRDQAQCNKDWWTPELERNGARDRRTDELITERGWAVVRFLGT